jgi:hypothetical protein
MKKLLLLVLLSASLSAQSEHGRWANLVGHVCYKGPEQEGETTFPIQHHCDCQFLCDPAPMEDKRCVTYCGSRQCLCHADESCDAPLDPKP